MQAVDVGLIGGLLARLLDDALDLVLRVADEFLDAGGMNAAIGDELGQSAAGDFAPHRVEAAHGDGFGRIVDDDVHPRGLLEGADVAAVAADDASLHLVTRQGHDGDDHVGHLFAGQSLDRQGDDLAGLFIGRFLGAVVDLAHHPRQVLLGLFLYLLDENGARLVGRHGGGLFQLLAVFRFQVTQFVLSLVDPALAFVEQLFALFQSLGLLILIRAAAVDALLGSGQVLIAPFNRLVGFEADILCRFA